MTLVFPGISVENNDTPISVPVGHEHLIGFLVDDNGRRPTHVNGIVAVGFYSGMPDLQQELSIPGELEYLAIPVSIAGQPDVVFVVNRDAMLAAPGTPVAIGPLLI